MKLFAKTKRDKSIEGDRTPRTLAIEIKGPEDVHGDAAQNLLRMALGPFIERYGDRVKDLSLHLSPPPRRWLVVIETTPATDADAHDMNLLFEQCVTRVGARLR